MSDSILTPTGAYEMLISGDKVNESIVDSNFTVIGTFTGTNIQILSTNANNAFDIGIVEQTEDGGPAFFELTDSTVVMNSMVVNNMTSWYEYAGYFSGSKAKITGGSVSVNYLTVKQGADLTLKGTDLSAPGGRFYLYAQGDVHMSDLEIAPGALLQCSEYENWQNLDGAFVGEKLTIGAGTEIQVSATHSFTLRDCMFKAGEERSLLQISRSECVDGGDNTKIITGCNLSNVKVQIKTLLSGSTDVIDLSGNYWGEGYDSLEKIIPLIDGYDSSYVIINDFKLSDPFAPEFSLNEPSLTKAAEGKMKVTLSWKASDAYSYTLTVDGKEVYRGKNSSYTLTLGDGKHSYTVVATDDQGTSTTLLDSFSCDATAPELTLNTPVLTSAGEGKVKAQLSWKGETGAQYVVKVDGKKVWSGKATSYTITMADGSHQYEVSATDAAGNISTARDSFSFDASAPKVVMQKPVLGKASKGKAKVTLNWSSEVGSTYTLVLDGKTVIAGKKKTSWKGNLKDGSHSYTLIAKGANGNTNKVDGTFRFDATAPVVSLGKVTNERVSNGVAKVTLNWESSEAATYTVTVDKRVVYTGSKSSVTLQLPDGKHNYVITATDASGNKSSSKGKFAADTTAPVIKFKEPKIKALAGGKVQVNLSWKGESKATYELLVDGVSRYKGTKASCSLVLSGSNHEYVLVATDLAGNRSETPELALADPVVKKVAERQVKVTFNWEGETGTACVLKVDGKSYSVKGSSYSLTLKDGKHKYSLTSTDAAGNSVTLAGSFVCDATAPKLKLSKPKVGKAENGQAAVQFKWSGEKGATCVLTVDGKVYAVSGKSYTMSLAHGTHEYSLTATDAAGNSTKQSGSVWVDGGLDQQLALSAGSYALPMSACATAPVAAASLTDLALNSSKQQGTLAGLS